MFLLARVGVAFVVALAFLGCDGTPCALEPCGPEPIAFKMTLMSNAGGPVPGARFDGTFNGHPLFVSGGPSYCGTGAAKSTCILPGDAGTYDITISAPGFVTARMVFEVNEAPPLPSNRCDPCGRVATQDITVVMVPSPPSNEARPRQKRARREAGMFFADLEPCRYFVGRWADFLIAVGWLEPEQPFRKAPVSEAFTAALASLLKKPWQPVFLAGPHCCGFCLAQGASQPAFGIANLFVPAGEKVFAVPEMIAHYVRDHGYAPPEEFQTAVLRCPPMHSGEFLAQVRPERFTFPPGVR